MEASRLQPPLAKCSQLEEKLFRSSSGNFVTGYAFLAANKVVERTGIEP
jgi:hypothetical protein